MNLRWIVGAVALAMCAVGCAETGDESDSSDEALSSNVNSPANAARFAAVAAKLPSYATKAASDFAKETGTTPLTQLVSATCTGKKELLGADPGFWWHGCNFVFKNGTGTTTFSTSISGEAVAKGGPDLNREPDAHGKYPVAKHTTVKIVMDPLMVTSGTIPAITPIAISDTAAVEAYVTNLMGGPNPDPGARASGEFSTDGCNGFIEPSSVPSSGRVYCYYYGDADDFDGIEAIIFEASGNQLVGVRYVNSDAGF